MSIYLYIVGYIDLSLALHLDQKTARPLRLNIGSIEKAVYHDVSHAFDLVLSLPEISQEIYRPDDWQLIMPAAQLSVG